MSLPLSRPHETAVLRGFASIHGRRLETATIVPAAVGARAPTLVFLHGAFGSLSSWDRFPREVAQTARCPALVYSRAGHGRSDAPASGSSGDYLQVEAQSVLPALLDSQGIERPLFVGHEDGAAIALIYAAGFDAAGIVALSPRTRIDELAVSAVQDARTRLDAGEAMPSFVRHHRDPASLLARWASLWALPATRAWSLAPFLERVNAPVVLIQGEDDEHANLADLTLLARALHGRVQSIQLEAVGGSPWEDAPHAIATAIASLAARVRGRGV